MQNRVGLFKMNKAVVKRRCIHLDLKGVPPTSRRLVRLLEIFAAARYNSVLVEWEDSFPWTVDKRFRSETAYSSGTIKKFVKAASDLGIEIIPLVQCLGHMETPLRLREYKHLRETAGDGSVLNPLAQGARELVEKMVDDVLSLMPDVRLFHLGGDEAWTFGTHPETKKYVAKHGKGALYLHHVEPLLDKLNRRNIRPMLWHDMMRDWDSAALRRLARKADLVVWGYSGHPYAMGKHCNKDIIERFAGHNVPLWGATAYKGADGNDKDLPDIACREANALAWVEVAKRYGFAGVIATAWSRYTTDICQNEPIDGALDSAFDVGAILHDGKIPQGGIEACRRALGDMGEGRIFRRVRDALFTLTQTRDSAWQRIRVLREVIMTVSHDRRRLPCFWMVKSLNELRNALQRADAAGNELQKALTGLMEPIWVERYIAERVEPLREEFFALKGRIKRLSPAAYGVLFRS